MRIGVLLGSMALSWVCTAQHHLYFEHFNHKRGLSDANVTSVYEDREGFVWVATESGLNRFDGVRFHNLNNRSVGSSLYFVTGDKEDNIWFTSNKVHSYNKRSGVISTFLFYDSSHQELQPARCTKIAFDKSNQLWALTDLGIFVKTDSALRPASFVYTALKELNTKDIQSAATFVYDSLQDGFWIGTATGLVFLDLKNNKLFSKKNNPGKSALFELTSPVASLAFRNNDFWVSTNDGLHQFKVIDSSRRECVPVKIVPMQQCYILYIDSQQRLWGSTWESKVFYQEAGGDFHIIQTSDELSYSFPAGNFNSIYEDSQSNLWFGTYGSLALLNANNFVKNVIKLSSERNTGNSFVLQINNIKTYQDSLLWVCTDVGLFKVNFERNVSTTFLIHTKEFKPNRFFDIIEVGDSLWCGTGNGIKIFHPAKGTFTEFAFYPDAAIKSKSVSWLFQDSRKNIWFSVWNDAIYHFNTKTKECRRMASPDLYGDIGSTNSLHGIEAANKILWFGYGAKGIRCYDYHTGKFYNPMTSSSDKSKTDNTIVYHLLENKEHEILASTLGDGLLIIDEKSGIIKSQFTTGTGLKSNKVLSTLYNDNGNLWILTSAGLNEFNTANQKIENLELNFNTPFFSGNSYLRRHKDNILVASLNVINAFSTAYDRYPQALTAPVISGVQSGDNPTPFRGWDEEFSVAADVSYLRFFYASPDHEKFPSIKYRYKLEGWDEGWRDAHGDLAASYSNIAPGRYTFKVAASVNGTDWQECIYPAKIYHEPFFWETLWFELICILVIIIILYTIAAFVNKFRTKQKFSRLIDYFASSVYGQNSIDEICHDISRTCIRQLRLDHCAVFIYDDETKEYKLRSFQGPIDQARLQMLVKHEGIDIAAKNKESIIQDDRLRNISIAFTPLVEDGITVGVLQCGKIKAKDLLVMTCRHSPPSLLSMPSKSQKQRRLLKSGKKRSSC